MATNSLELFGGSRPFLIPPWQTVDDRVRGGSSISNLEALPNNGALFSGNLDTTTLGGAGFASQFSQEVKGGWDLSAYAGILLNYCEADGKTYTVIIKDEAREEQRQDGREKAGLSWESHFEGKEKGGQVWVKWDDFKPVYRGKEQEEVREIKVDEVHRFGLMIRSFFNNQSGNFSIKIDSLLARSVAPETS